MKIDVLVVGAGFAGAVAAERFASAGKNVVVVEQRDHVGGNAHDRVDSLGILIHPYGPHIFHTNSPAISDYLSRFTAWRPYEHKVLASVRNKLLPIPINRTTINKLYGLNLDESGVEDYLESVQEKRPVLKTSEDVVLSRVGPDLCELFFRGYTRKQWDKDLSELDAGVAARIPVRSNDDDRYFTDTFQKMPLAGYSAMFHNILDHPNIRVELGSSFDSVRDRYEADLIVYTGPLDGYFNYSLGKLPYRSLRFEHIQLADQETYQAVGTVNYPCTQEYTRITEFKYLTGQNHPGTSIVREYGMAEGDPYYPVPTKASALLCKQYEQMAEAESGTIFVGRLAQYRYYNMDQVVGSALKAVSSYLA